jgi:hypothetical protein
MLSDTLLDSFRCALVQATNDAEFMVPRKPGVAFLNRKILPLLVYVVHVCCGRTCRDWQQGLAAVACFSSQACIVPVMG